MHRSIRVVLPVVAAAAIGSTTLVAHPVGAASSRTSGDGVTIDASWTEYDPDDLLGLPGNVHIGFIYADQGPYGTYVYGSVIDFDCEEGEVPWGGHGVIVDDSTAVATASAENKIDDIIDAGGSELPATEIVAAIEDGLNEEITQTVVDEFEEIPACDWVQDRYLGADEGAVTLQVNAKARTATLRGRLVVHGGHGGHGEEVEVLGRPPVNLTVTGGEWNVFEWSWKSRGANYRYESTSGGKSWYGGVVAGAIGPMGFADDADDTAVGGFAAYTYRTVERVR